MKLNLSPYFYITYGNNSCRRDENALPDDQYFCIMTLRLNAMKKAKAKNAAASKKTKKET